MPGRTARQVLEADPAKGGSVVEALARFLRRLHSLPADTCPFDGSHGVRMAAARDRIEAAQVDVDDSDAERQGWTAEQVWRAMTDLLPLATDTVVMHGDFSLDNALIAEGEVVGCIDVGRVGTADRYQDLATLWNGPGDVGPALQDRLFEAYGIAPDRQKIDFHLLLDELF